MKTTIIALIFSFLSVSVSVSVSAKVIQVLPGFNTLQAAFDQTDHGDTVVLIDGVYTTSVNLTIAKSITLRAQTPGIYPVVELANESLTVNSFALYSVIQGIHFRNTANSSALVMDSGKNTLVGNLFNGVGVQLNRTSYFIGNDFTKRDGRGVLSSFGPLTYVAANRFTNMQSDQSGTVRMSSTANYLVGNSFSCSGVASTASEECFQVNSGGAKAYVVGNLFTLAISQITTLDETLNAHFVRFLDMRSTESTVASNIFTYAVSAGTLGRLKSNIPLAVSGGTRHVIHNNVFYGQGDLPSVDGEAIAIASSSVTTRVSNNVILNWQGPAYDRRDNEAIVNRFLNNICFGANTDTSACIAEDDNQIVDPGFDNLTDFLLASGSAAIDTGEILQHLSDIDGSRGDIGIHGGPFGFSQFYDQRLDGTKPYIFPLFDETKLLNIDELTVKAVSVARFK